MNPFTGNSKGKVHSCDDVPSDAVTMAVTVSASTLGGCEGDMFDEAQTFTMALKTVLTGHVAEHQKMALTCPEGEVISSIPFASYGTAEGSDAASFRHHSCHAKESTRLWKSSVRANSNAKFTPAILCSLIPVVVC